LAASQVHTFRLRIPFTKRSCAVSKNLSIRPLAWGDRADIRPRECPVRS
jgi:hypothetical protein